MQNDVGSIVQRSAIDERLLVADGHAKAEPAYVIDYLEPAGSRTVRVGLETQRIPGPFIRKLQLRAHRDDRSGPHEKRQGLQGSVVLNPACPGKLTITPVIDP